MSSSGTAVTPNSLLVNPKRLKALPPRYAKQEEDKEEGEEVVIYTLLTFVTELHTNYRGYRLLPDGALHPSAS